MQAYSDKSRKDDPWALPDLDVFLYTSYEGSDPTECPNAGLDGDYTHEHGPDCDGYYWQSCFPGCLPDSDPVGPFKTQEEAIADGEREINS